MLNRLTTITNSKAISKTEQIKLNGGNFNSSCAALCPIYGAGQYCLVDGDLGSPAVCDGRGGFIYL